MNQATITTSSHNEIIETNSFEYLFINSLSKKNSEENEIKFNLESQQIVQNLSEKRFVILFPEYWTHNQVKKFGEQYTIPIEDFTWYLKNLKEFINNRELHFIEKINYFHCFGFTRFIEEKNTMISDILGFTIKRDFDFKNLANISAFTLLSMQNNLEMKDLIPFLTRMKDNPLLLEFYAKYQIYYYGGIKNCLTQLKSYQDKNDIRINVIPQTLLSLKLTEKMVNFDELEEFRNEFDYLFERLPNNMKKCITIKK